MEIGSFFYKKLIIVHILDYGKLSIEAVMKLYTHQILRLLSSMTYTSTAST